MLSRMLYFAPRARVLDAARVEDVPMNLKARIDGSQGNIRRGGYAKRMARHFFAN